MKLKTKKKVTTKQEEIYRDHLAGVQFSDYQRARLTPGMKLQLVWERSNARDPRAIAVYAGNHRIGYVKKSDTEIIHSAREAGMQVEAVLVSFNKTNPTWQMIVISITVTREVQTDVKF